MRSKILEVRKYNKQEYGALFLIAISKNRGLSYL
jgi:hypothetical protein